MQLTPDQRHEAEKYTRAYQRSEYAMAAGARFQDARDDLVRLDQRGSLLDVGAGRGEICDLAEELGFDPVHGVELIPELCDGHRIREGLADGLPFYADAFEVVTMFDVIEHLLPWTEIPALRELRRVARRVVILSANNRPSYCGHDIYHINVKPYDEWHGIICGVFGGSWDVEQLAGRRYVSETWKITKRPGRGVVKN